MSAEPIFLAVAAAIVVYLLVRYERRHGAQDHADLHTDPAPAPIYVLSMYRDRAERRDHHDPRSAA